MNYETLPRRHSLDPASLPALDQIKPIATYLVRSPGSYSFVSRQAALEKVAQVFRKYLNQLPAELTHSLLHDRDQNISYEQTVAKLKAYHAEADKHREPDRQWLASADRKAEKIDFDAPDPWNGP